MTSRLTWLDLARGFAVVSMVVAHTSPWGGILVGTEYLTAPWFALLVGISLLLAWEKADARAGAFIIANVARGLILILVGEWLRQVYWQIDIVLQTLGVLTIVLAPVVVLLGRRPAVWAALAVVMVAVSPLSMDAARVWLDGGANVPGWVARAVGYLAAGTHYRVTTFFVIAAAGIAAVPWLLRKRATAGARGGLTAVGLLAGAAVSYVVGRFGPWGADAYSGTTPEIVGATLLSLSATWFCAWLVWALGEQRVRAWLGAVVDTGRMAFTAYVVQVLSLAFIMTVWLPGQRDDNVPVMLGVIALCLGVSWVWLKAYRVGPLEWLLRLPGRLQTRKTGLRARGGE